MTPREIIAAAWVITTREPSLRRWAFTSSILETLLKVKLVGTQFYFAYAHFFGDGQAGFFDVELALYKAVPFWFFLIIMTLFVIMVIVEFFFPHLSLGALIGLSAKSYRKEEVKGGLVLGLYNFFAIFAIHEFLTLGSLSTIITICSLIIRYIDGPLGSFAIGVILFLFICSLLLKFFFSFAEEAVVIQKMGIFAAIGRSFKLIVSNLSHIMFLLILLFVISLRIFVNAVAVILIPAIILGLGLLLTSILPAIISYSITTLVGIGLIVGASYVFAYMQAFKVSVWTITYLELIKQKDLDIIVDNA